ncbi:MAG: addiction module protein [Balneolaceae bacterium]|nr:addiction module protein [Balneolaceae bacterium]
MKTKQLIDEISDLPVDQRAKIADHILKTLNTSDPNVEKAWFQEVETRMEEYRKGKVKLIPAEEVFKSLREITDKE